MMTESAFWLLVPAVFGASLLQSATGIGYGVIAGPILLVVLNGNEAFQISTVHNFLIALMLTPFVFRASDRFALRCLLIGSAFGIPAGFIIQALVGVMILKLVSAVAVFFVAAALVMDMAKSARAGESPAIRRGEPTIVGAIAGTMGGMLAMPGPVASTWMSIRGWQKTEIRATILTFFLFAYGAGLLLHVLFGEISKSTVELSLVLTPAVVLGILAGNRVTGWLSETAFRGILLVVLLATVAGLLGSL